MPVEAGLELGAIVGVDCLHLEGQPVENQVDEVDGCLLIESLIGPEYARRVQSSIAVYWYSRLRWPAIGEMNLTSTWKQFPGCGFS
jgi:hypothetical protein